MVNAPSQTSELADFEFIPPMYYRKTYISDNNGLVLGCAVVVSDKSGKTLRTDGGWDLPIDRLIGVTSIPPPPAAGDPAPSLPPWRS